MDKTAPDHSPRAELQALKAENSRLRAENARLRRADRRPCTDLTESAIAVGLEAPHTARLAVTNCLAERVAPGVLETALLLVSELVANSVRHSGASDGDDIVVRIQLWGDHCRVEVEDCGCGGTIAPREPEVGKSGLGLHMVQAVSERWGVVHAPDGPTRVWAQLACA